jgi:hypothetical protein
MKKMNIKKNVIQEYCKKYNTCITDFSKICGIKRGILYNYNYGARLPNIKNMAILEQATNGEINYYSFFPKSTTPIPSTNEEVV